MNNESDSVGAIIDCMKAIGFPFSFNYSQTASARVLESKSRPMRGDFLDVTFIYPLHGDPRVEFGFGETYKCFNIDHPGFNPEFGDSFEFDAKEVELRIIGKTDDFVLSFRHIVPSHVAT